MDNVIFFLSVFSCWNSFLLFSLYFTPCYRFDAGVSCWMTKMVLRLLVENIQSSVVSLLRTLAFIAGISLSLSYWDMVLVFRQFVVCSLVSVCDGCGYHSLGLHPDGSLTFERTLQGKKVTIKETEARGERL